MYEPGLEEVSKRAISSNGFVGDSDGTDAPKRKLMDPNDKSLSVTLRPMELRTFMVQFE